MRPSTSLQVFCLLALASAQHASANNVYHRQASSQPGITGTSSTTTSTSSTTSSVSESTSTVSATHSSTTTSTTSSTSTTLTSQASSPASITQPPPSSPSQFTTKDINGSEVTVTVTTTSSSTSASPTQTSGGSSDSGGLGTGSIVGMSVAGGVAVIGIIAFFVWKFTRKRFADFDDNEAIKWPDLNTHGGAVDSHPLPVHNTGRAGFDTGSEPSLSRVPSSTYSTPDFGANGPDPYAVPPLPHLNPNQPYRDDPTGATGYYDPYRGPVPGTLETGVPGGEWGGEAIPMTQMNQPAYGVEPAAYEVGRRSPGPQAAYGVDPVYNSGRQSPGAQVAYGGRSSPGPQAAYGGGRTSPGPQAAYGGGRSSPGPQAAYGNGRSSPGPQAAYGGGRTSPGPNVAYGGANNDTYGAR